MQSKFTDEAGQLDPSKANLFQEFLKFMKSKGDDTKEHVDENNAEKISNHGEEFALDEKSYDDRSKERLSVSKDDNEDLDYELEYSNEKIQGDAYDEGQLEEQTVSKNKSSNQIEEMAIKGASVDFEKLLEMRLKEDPDAIGDQEALPRKAPFRQSKRFKKDIVVSKPGSEKKYTYYADKWKNQSDNTEEAPLFVEKKSSFSSKVKPEVPLKDKQQTKVTNAKIDVPKKEVTVKKTETKLEAPKVEKKEETQIKSNWLDDEESEEPVDKGKLRFSVNSEKQGHFEINFTKQGNTKKEDDSRSDSEDRSIIDKYANKRPSLPDDSRQKLAEPYKSAQGKETPVKETTVCGNDRNQNLLKKYFKMPYPAKSQQVEEVAEKPKIEETLQIKQKEQELEDELKSLKKEREKAQKLKTEYEKLTKALRKEVEEFYAKREEELKEFNLWKEEEYKKLKKEKAVHTKNLQEMQKNYTKKEKEEIEGLKKELIKQKDEFKAKENNSKLRFEKIRKQLEEANARIFQLEKEVKIYEEIRIKQSFLEKKPKEPNLVSKDMFVDRNKRDSISSKDILLDRNNKDLIASKDTLFDKKHKEPNFISKDAFQEKKEARQVVQNKPGTTDKRQSASNQIATKPAETVVKRPVEFTRSAVEVAVTKKDKMEDLLLQIEKRQFNQDDSVENEEKYEFGDESFESEPDESYDLVFPDKYHGKVASNARLIKSNANKEGVVVNEYENGMFEVVFKSGGRKLTFPDDYVLTYLKNGDIKQTFPDGKMVYFFKANETVESTFPDGLKVYKFSDGQIEKHFPDQSKQIILPDKSIKYILHDGHEETINPDGSHEIVHVDGTVVTNYPDGSKVIM